MKLTEDLIPGLVGSLQSKDKEACDLAYNIIKNVCDKQHYSKPETIDKLFNTLLNCENMFNKVKTKELWIIKMNDVWVKPNNSGNGFYKSKLGAKKALSNIINTKFYWYDESKRYNETYIAYRIRLLLQKLVPNKRYVDSRYKKSIQYLRGSDAAIKFFYENNKIEFVKIDI